MGHPGYVSVKYLGSAFPFFSFSLSISFSFVLVFFQEGAFDPTRRTREDFLEEGAFRLGFGESSANVGSDWRLGLNLRKQKGAGSLGNTEESRAASACTGRVGRQVKWGYRGPGAPTSDGAYAQMVRNS